MALALCAGFLQQVLHTKESSEVPQKQLALLGGKFQRKNPTPTRGFTTTRTKPALQEKKMDLTVSEVCAQTQETGGHK